MGIYDQNIPVQITTEINRPGAVRRDETGIEPPDDKLDPRIRCPRQIVGDDQASFVFHAFLKG
jgi:hypothetical protein